MSTDAGGIAQLTAFRPVSGVSGTAVPNQPGLSQTSFNIYPFVAGTTVAIVFPASDHTPPQANLVTPSEGASYYPGQNVPADYSCQDEAGGSGISRCEGTVPDGQPIDTSSVGTFSFTVTAVDRAGNSSTVTHDYTVAVLDHDVAITKTAAPSNPRPGDLVVYTIYARNLSNAAANDVVVTDSLPSGVTYDAHHIPDPGSSSESMGTVTCEIGTLAPGEEVRLLIKVQVDPLTTTADPAADHLLDVQKVEAQVDLNPGELKSVSVTCPSGYLATDGSVRIDHIDQGTGDWDAPQVLESRAAGLQTWQGSVKNTASGRAQAKIFAVCVRQQTGSERGHSHNLTTTDQIYVNHSATTGTDEATLQCGPGQVAIQPGFTTDAPGNMVYSQPCRTTAGSSPTT